MRRVGVHDFSNETQGYRKEIMYNSGHVINYTFLPTYRFHIYYLSRTRQSKEAEFDLILYHTGCRKILLLHEWRANCTHTSNVFSSHANARKGRKKIKF